jgi:hypothetical protein
MRTRRTSTYKNPKEFQFRRRTHAFGTNKEGYNYKILNSYIIENMTKNMRVTESKRYSRMCPALDKRNRRINLKPWQHIDTVRAGPIRSYDHRDNKEQKHMRLTTISNL